jgi:hypothetical protein
LELTAEEEASRRESEHSEEWLNAFSKAEEMQHFAAEE